MATVGQNTVSKEEIIGTATTYGQRLGFLIAALNIETEVKEALLAILPAMTPEQVERFSGILEAAYLSEKTIDVDDQLKTTMASIKAEHELALADLENETLVELNTLDGQANKAKEA
jgi:hypothetical protein